MDERERLLPCTTSSHIVIFAGLPGEKLFENMPGHVKHKCFDMLAISGSY